MTVKKQRQGRIEVYTERREGGEKESEWAKDGEGEQRRKQLSEMSQRTTRERETLTVNR